MTNQEIHEPKDYSEEVRKLLTTDPSHADVFNPLFERLINNDVFLKSLTERLIQEHTHSGVDGEGSQIPLANIKMPIGEGEIVTDKELATHINERNPHGTRPTDVGAASKQEFDEHSTVAASTLKSGHVQLSSSTTSSEETKAATPNAVKKVNDAVGTLAGAGNTKTVKQLADEAASHSADDVKHGGNILGASINSNVKTEGMLMQYQNGLWGAYDPHPLASIGFRGILYDKGIEHIPIEIGYESGIGSQIKNSDHLFMQANSVDGTTRTYVIGEPIDLTHINVLKADWTVQGDSVSVGGTGRFYVSTTKLASSGSTIYTKQTIPEVREIAELNVATLNGLHYVMVQAYDTSGAKRNSRVKAYKIWGE